MKKTLRSVRQSAMKLTLSAVMATSLAGCASGGMYSGGENLAGRTVAGALVGTAVGGLTASSNDVRGGLRSGAAIGAAAGLIFGAGENYQAAQDYNRGLRAGHRSQRRYQRQSGGYDQRALQSYEKSMEYRLNQKR